MHVTFEEQDIARNDEVVGEISNVVCGAMKMCSVANLWLGTLKTKADIEDTGKLQEAILRLGPELPASSLLRKILKLPVN